MQQGNSPRTRLCEQDGKDSYPQHSHEVGHLGRQALHYASADCVFVAASGRDDSVSTQQITPEIQAKPLKGKYDGRRNNRPTAEARQKAGRKLNWAKHLTSNDSAKILKDIDSIASPSEIYQRALDRNLLALCWQIRERVEDRLLGKPFVAENPNAVKPINNILNDNRLQIAIQQLVPAKQVKKRKTKELVQAVSEAKQLEAVNEPEQSYVDVDAQVVESIQDGSK